MSNKKLFLESVSLIILIIVISFGLSFAYFRANIVGNEDSNTMSAGGATFKIEYTGSNVIKASDVVPGWSDTKYFKVDITNTKQKTVNYNINLVVSDSNFYYNDSYNKSYLTYSLYECSDSSFNNCTTKVVDSTLMDVYTNGSKLVSKIKNNKTEIKYYAFVVEFPDTGFEQEQEGTDGNPLRFSGYINIDSLNRYYDDLVIGKMSEYLADLDKTSNGLAEDDTADSNLRFVGSNPNNYVSFNNEMWRIIGTFNVYNKETDCYERLVKIVRNESIGAYSWDTSDENVNYGYGINEWSQADLMTELNTDYIDTSKTSGTTMWNIFNGTSEYNYSNNIKSAYIDKIANVRWNLGAISENASIDPLQSYNEERGTIHINNPADGVTRKYYWDGKIGLIYPSDYIYAYSNQACQKTTYMCTSDNWLYDIFEMSNNGSYSYTITSIYNVNEGYEFIISDIIIDSYAAVISSSLTCNGSNVFPSLYLKSDVQITGGTGTESDPYTID